MNSKKILVVKGKSAYNVLRCAADEICKGFRNCGYQVDVVDVLKEGAAEQLLAYLEHREEYAFYFSVQALLWNMEQIELPQLQELRRVGWIVDDPVYHTGRLMLSTGRNAYVLMVRDSHAKQVKADYPYFECVDVLYHGGFLGEERVCYEEKDIDVFFPGTYVPLEESAQKVREIEGAFGTIADNAKERMVGRNLASSWMEELHRYLQEIHFEISEEEFRALVQVMAPLDQYQRDYMRQSIVETLLQSGIKVSVVGAGWNKYDGHGKENLEILSDTGVDITEVVRLMQRSRIVLNNTNILDGMHERIFTAMLAKAVCVTNEFELLNRLFRNGRELVTFPLNRLEVLPQIVKELLGNTKKAKQIAEAGYQTAVHSHTWEHRGEQIVRWVEHGGDFEYG